MSFDNCDYYVLIENEKGTQTKNNPQDIMTLNIFALKQDSTQPVFFKSRLHLQARVMNLYVAPFKGTKRRTHTHSQY